MSRRRSGLSQREYAKLAGISRAQVRKDIARGLVVLHPDGSIDGEASLRLRRELVDPVRSGEARGRLPPGANVAEFRRELLRLDVALKCCELERRQAEVVDRARAREAIRAITRAILDHIRRWPERAAAGLAAALGIEDTARVRTALERRLAAHLEELGPLEPRL